MTRPPAPRLTAGWATRQPHALRITGQSGAVLARIPARPAGNHPGPLMLAGTGWAAYPGSQWQEDPPGRQTVAVSGHPPLPEPAPRS